MSQRQGKYNARKTPRDGILFHSRREANRYSELKLMEAAGEITDLELQVPYPCEVNGVLVCKYFADFRYKTNIVTGESRKGGDVVISNWREVVEDAKGYRTPAYRLKNKLVRALYGVIIVEV